MDCHTLDEGCAVVVDLERCGLGAGDCGLPCIQADRGANGLREGGRLEVCRRHVGV